MLDSKKNYVIEDYQKKSLFYSFLPGISGEKGIPLWCHYLNRGQGIASFGVQDKDHGIMEFYPAHQAAQRTPLLGFRTFLKVNGKFQEAFADYDTADEMVIGMNSLVLREKMKKSGLMVEVEYESLPEEPVAGLLRKITVRNIGRKERNIEIADGMAELLPYGVSSSSMKEMGQTTKAWMQVLDAERRVPLYKVRASMEDSACVTEVNGVHYGLAREENGALLPVIVDRKVLFHEDTSLKYPHGFVQNTTETLLEEKQCTCNDAACCFFLTKKVLQPGEELILEELYGMAESKNILEKLVKRTQEPRWFDKKRQIAARLPIQLTDRIATRTGNQVFDAYCRQTYLDNLLRGGYPIEIGNKVVYLYSRKHGDMERDYNYFSMLPEYYSQGNGNFRDVNQNRRCEPQFAPFVGDRNIRLFYNALQIDGYNPLKIEKMSYILDKKEFTPGELYQSLEQKNGPDQKEETDRMFVQLLSESQEKETTSFGEGYWCDHWTYNLDLVESYLGVFPEKKESLLFEDHSYTYRQSEAHILPRAKRYVKTQEGIRQYHFLEMREETPAPGNPCLADENGKTVTATLFEKMFSLAVVKMAALDPYGMGIEMEGGKPGWYDALNGLPGLLGSSMAETCELERLVAYLLQILGKIPENQGKTITILTEIEELAQKILESGRNYLEEKQDTLEAVKFWNQINTAKEAFREKTARNVKGTICGKSATQIREIIRWLLWKSTGKMEM